MHLKDGRRINLTGLSDEHAIWQLRRVRSVHDIASTDHTIGAHEGPLAVASAERLERLWHARWN